MIKSERDRFLIFTDSDRAAGSDGRFELWNFKGSLRKVELADSVFHISDDGLQTTVLKNRYGPNRIVYDVSMF